jgi:hypothetical protein
MLARLAGNPLVRWGVISGAAVAALGIVGDLLMQWLHTPQGNLPLLTIVALGLFGTAGYFTMRATDRLAQATLAGLLAGIVAALLITIVETPLAYALRAPTVTPAAFWAVELPAAIEQLFIYLTFGTLGAAAGGAIALIGQLGQRR